MIAILPPAVAWSQMVIQDWKHVKAHLGTRALWKKNSVYEKMRIRISVSYVFPYDISDIKKRK